MCVCKMWPISARTLSFLLQTSRKLCSHSKIPIRCLWTAFCVPLSYIFFTKNNTLNGVCMLNVTAAHWNNICYWGDSAIVSLPHLDRRDTMGLFSSTRQPHTRCALRCTAAGRQRGGSGVEGTGVEWRGGQGRGGQGRAGQGRVPDCLGGPSRVGISSRSTRPVERAAV